jgi:hypothetical protein
MDDRQALSIVSALAYGANPITGEMFPSDSPYQTPEVIRALFVATRALEAKVGVQVTAHGTESTPRAAPTAQSRPTQGNAGKPWTAEEDARLLAAFDANTSLAEIAKAHGRTQGGVRARLEKHGRLEPSDATRWPTNAGPRTRSGSSKQYPESSR